MPQDSDTSQHLQETVRSALERKAPLQITGSGTKSFFGRCTEGDVVSVSAHRGVIEYEPTELVITARSGTPLSEIDTVLGEGDQMLAFEPPRFGATATLGGAVACGLSGPRRPFTGSARDFVLGVNCLSGKGEVLRFGGQVMKNVAGYDVSRLMCGALGTLGILLEVSLKVLPRPDQELTVRFESDTAQAIQRMNALAAQPLPLSAACYWDEGLYLRLSGTQASVAATQRALGGEPVAHGHDFWRDLREQRLRFFAGDEPLWRLSVLPAAPPLDLTGQWLLDWAGAQRWLRSHAKPAEIQQAAASVGGHATLFRGGDHSGEVFQPLQPELMALHRRLKKAFDPHAILNPGRMYRDW